MVTWALLILLLFVPMMLEFALASEILTSIQRLFPYWKDKSVSVFLSDILFIQAGAFIVFGTLVAGAVLYNAWASMDIRQLQFTKYIWNWRKIREERDFPTGLAIGLTILGAGKIYLLVAINTSF